jgi:hypothetical protein
MVMGVSSCQRTSWPVANYEQGEREEIRTSWITTRVRRFESIFTGMRRGESPNETNRPEEEDKDDLGQHIEGWDEMDVGVLEKMTKWTILITERNEVNKDSDKPVELEEWLALCIRLA